MCGWILWPGASRAEELSFPVASDPASRPQCFCCDKTDITAATDKRLGSTARSIEVEHCVERTYCWVSDVITHGGPFCDWPCLDNWTFVVRKLAGEPQVREWLANRLSTFLPCLVQSRKRTWCSLCFAFEKGSSPTEAERNTGEMFMLWNVYCTFVILKRSLSLIYISYSHVHGRDPWMYKWILEWTNSTRNPSMKSKTNMPSFN